MANFDDFRDVEDVEEDVFSKTPPEKPESGDSEDEFSLGDDNLVDPLSIAFQNLYTTRPPKSKGKQKPSINYFPESVSPLDPADEEDRARIYESLLENQKEVWEETLKKFYTYRCMFLFAVPGSGKTFLTCATMRYYGMNILFIVCEKSAMGFWREVCLMYGYNEPIIITYASLISSKYVRKEIVAHGQNTEITFTATHEWQQLVNENIGFVLDESQKIKGDAQCARAVQSMSGVIVERGKTNSRVIGLSGTPYDKDIYCENMYRFMGLLTQKNICSQHINVGMNYAGFQEIQEKLTRLLEKGGIDVDLHEADHRIMSGSARKKDLIQILHRWFFQHVVPHLSVSMTRIISDALFVPTNQHYAIDQENGILLWQYLVMLMKIYKYNPENDTIVMDRNTARSTLPLMKKIELVKVKAILIPKVLEVLRTRPKAKVVTFCTFLESLRMIREACEDYNPLTLQGNVLADARTRMISAFQKNESRVFNTNMGTGATSISLHGTNEDDEIHVFIIPTFSLEKMQQAVYRAYRSGSKGSVYVNVVYANIDLPEQRLGRAIMKKTKVYNELLFQQVENGMVFPGDYPIKKEGPTLRLHSITPEGQSIVDKYEREMERLTRSTRRRSGEEE